MHLIRRSTTFLIIDKYDSHKPITKYVDVNSARGLLPIFDFTSTKATFSVSEKKEDD
jgi:hypothetical protein